MSDSLRPCGLQQSSLPFPSPTPGAYSNSCLESVLPSNHLILCHPLLLKPSVLPSIRVFSSESVLRIRWPKYWSVSFSINPSNELYIYWLILNISISSVAQSCPTLCDRMNHSMPGLPVHHQLLELTQTHVH